MALFKDKPPVERDGLYDRAQDTRFRSLNYRDQNPSRKEPFITKDLPGIYESESGNLGILGGNTDFILRAGTLKRSADDVSRITQLFTTGRGASFIAKQNLLSRTGVATEASGIINEGAYLPTSTIAQVGTNGLGGHLNKQGLNPFRGTSPDDGNAILGLNLTNPLALPLYAQKVKRDQPTNENRLVGFYNGKIQSKVGEGAPLNNFLDRVTNSFFKFENPTELYSYSGGPGAPLGVGNTQIRMSLEQRSGKNNVRLNQSGFFTTENSKTQTSPAKKALPNDFLTKFNLNTRGTLETGGDLIPNGTFNNTGYYNYSVFDRSYHQLDSIEIKGGQMFNPNGSLSRVYERLTGVDTRLDQVTTDNSISPLQNFETSVYKDDNGNATLDSVNPTQQTTLTQEQLRTGDRKERNTTNKILPDFRKEVNNKDKNIIGTSLDYDTQNIEKRVGLGDPGKRGDRSDYQTGKKLNGDAKSKPLDKITALPLYKSGGVATSSPDKNDLVKFRIAAIDSTNPANSVYMHFRAFLGSFVDNYNASWDTQKFMGRAENFYKYQGFDRSISMNWTVPAQSKNELMIMHQKLNYLASNLAPDYVGNQYMGGPLVRLTVGGYLYEQYGFIESLTLNVPEQSPWEIAIPSEGRGQNIAGSGGSQKDDRSVKELPHIMEVSGFTFKPIHNFVVQKQKNEYNGDKLGANSTLSNYGIQRYVSLASSGNATGYDVNLTDPNNIGNKSVSNNNTAATTNPTSAIKIGN